MLVEKYKLYRFNSEYMINYKKLKFLEVRIYGIFYWVGKKYFEFFSKTFFLFFKMKCITSLQRYMLHCCLRSVANALARKESRVRRSPEIFVQKT